MKSYALLDRINSPSDLQSLDISELNILCSEIREFLIETILAGGGHFAGNLGVVELSVALHYVFHSPHDSIIWDVGHQSYVHKILTGRRNQLHDIRQFSGISGFPRRSESEHDIFGTGHSSTSISAAYGIAVANRLRNMPMSKVIAVTGDGALTGGMSFEALNNLKNSPANVLVIVNDNHIGIDPNHGALDQELQHISKDDNFFTHLGLSYSGPVDGHNCEELVKELQREKYNTGASVLHVKTIKGKGYAPAEAEQTRWHSAPRFVKIEKSTGVSKKKWQDVFGETLLELAEENQNIVGITPAMPSGSGMISAMKKFPDRFFDVGIAEQHAVTMAAGLSTRGIIPFVNIYSSFLQRGYDQIIHDVALQNLPVIFCIDRAGLVGEDGPTHHGAFDISFLRPVPNIRIWAPASASELRAMLRLAVTQQTPVAIRYPKGDIPEIEIPSSEPILLQPIELCKGENTVILSTGIATQFARQAALQSKTANWHFPCIKPFPSEWIHQIFNDYSSVITVEDGSIAGGFGEAVAGFAAEHSYSVTLRTLGIGDEFVPHGSNDRLYQFCGYDTEGIIKAIEGFRHEA